MNLIDISVVAIIGICMLTGILKGFIKMLFGFISLGVTLVLTYTLYPIFSGIIITRTGLFEKISIRIMETFNLQEIAINAVSPQEQISVINGLSLPEKFRGVLIANNNPEVYKLMGAENVSEYISGSMATILINAISFITVFIIISILLGITISILDILSKLPLVNQVNKLGGALIGLGIGIVIIWIIFSVMTIFLTVNDYSNFMELIKDSKVAIILYENNPLIKFILNITKVLL